MIGEKQIGFGVGKANRMSGACPKCGKPIENHRRCKECVKPVCEYLDCPCEIKKALGDMPDVLEWAARCKAPDCGIPIARRDKIGKWRPDPTPGPENCPWCGRAR